MKRKDIRQKARKDLRLYRQKSVRFFEMFARTCRSSVFDLAVTVYCFFSQKYMVLLFDK